MLKIFVFIEDTRIKEMPAINGPINITTLYHHASQPGLPAAVFGIKPAGTAEQTLCAVNIFYVYLACTFDKLAQAISIGLILPVTHSS